MMPRGVKTLFVFLFLFFVFVIGFLIIEQRQEVLVMGKEFRKAKQTLSLLDTQLQEMMMEKTKFSLVTPSLSVKVVLVGYRDVYRVVIPEEKKKDEKNEKVEGILQLCLEWIREVIPSAKMEI